MPKPVLTQMPYAPHGGPDGLARKLLDFSVNSNPFGPPQELLQHLGELDISSYPDPSYRDACTAAATYHGVSSKDIVPGGAAELIYRLAACFLKPGKNVLIASPSFGEYGRSSLLHGAEVHLCDVYLNGLEPDKSLLIQAIQEVHPTLVWLCHPNNPTGHAWSVDALQDVALACRAHDALLVIDAAYLELSDGASDLPESAVKLFPLTKTFSIAGLRAGYAACPGEVAEVIRRAAPPWPVSTPAAAAVHWCRSPAGVAFVEASVPVLLELRQMFKAGLRRLGFKVWESRSSFFLTEVGDAQEFAARAKAAGFRVRDASSLGLPTCVRLAAQCHDDNEKLLKWLAC